jgi:hypoxanthine phosphoribosyltransferase
MEHHNQLNLGWNDVHILCRDVAKQLRGEYDVVVPIIRGGLVPAAIISNLLAITNIRPVRWQTRDDSNKDQILLQEIIQTYKRILIIDDILDSGKCLSEICQVIYSDNNVKQNTTVTFGVLLKNISYDNHVDEMYNLVYGKIFDRKIDKRWIVFPWERKDCYHCFSSFV